MDIERLANNNDRVSFKDRSEAFEFATKGIPGRHPFKFATLSLRSLLSEPEQRRPLSVTLPMSSMEQSGQMLSEEATRLEKVLQSDVDASDKEVDANPDTITIIQELSGQISRHLGETAV